MYIFITCTEEVFNRTCGNKIIGIISKIDRELLLIKLVRSPLDFFYNLLLVYVEISRL